MKGICIGQATYDITLPLENYPVENSKYRVSKKIECGGGSASNCAYLLAKWGVNTSFAGVVGNDYYGSLIKKEFEEIGVNTDLLEIKDDIKTSSSYIFVNTSNGTRTIVSDKEPFSYSKKYQQEQYDFIILDGYEKDYALEVLKNNPNAISMIDAGSMKEGTLELCSLADYIVCSHDFAEEFTGINLDNFAIEDLIKAYDIISNSFKGKLVITLEDKGSFVYSDGYKLVSSKKVKALDSTGAGDIYHGAFMYGLLQEWDILEVMKFANIAGALSVLRMGSRDSIFELEEVMIEYEKA